MIFIDHNKHNISGLIGRWDLESNVNFEAYLKALGVGFEIRKASGSVKPTIIISQNGNDEWTIRIESKLGPSEISFKLGQEFDEGFQFYCFKNEFSSVLIF